MGVVCEQACRRIDGGDGNEAVVLAEQPVGMSAMALARVVVPRLTWVPAGVMIWPLLTTHGVGRVDG